jgi:hypothetical protein
MDIIRFAKPEDIESISGKLDITPTSSVVTFGGKDFAVIRDVRELEPVVFHEDTTDKRKLFFLTNLETALRLQGTTEVYFNIPADDATYIKVMKNWGAEPVSTVPGIRFKKVL